MNEFNENNELDQAILRKLEYKIFSMEHDNHNTKKLTDSDMVTRIRKVIDDFVRQEVENDN